MTIRIGSNNIIFTSANGIIYTFGEDSSGFNFDGTITAKVVTPQYYMKQAGYGFVAGAAAQNPSTFFYFNNIEKFPFASTNFISEDVGDLNYAKAGGAGQSSSVSGYVSGGNGTPFVGNSILKYSFVVNKNSVQVGNITSNAYYTCGQSSSTHGYTSGGQIAPPGAIINTIDKFLFATDANATDVGDLTLARFYVAGLQSSTEGYTCGGQTPPATPTYILTNVVDKFPFATDTNATDVGDLTSIRYSSAGHQSSTEGYVSGGINTGSTWTNTIEKFPFASTFIMTDVGDLTSTVFGHIGLSSSTDGYATNPQAFSAAPLQGIVNFKSRVSKFPFASLSPSVGVGNIAAGTGWHPGGATVVFHVYGQGSQYTV